MTKTMRRKIDAALNRSDLIVDVELIQATGWAERAAVEAMIK